MPTPFPTPSPPPSTAHPPGCYYYNAVTGTVQRQCNPLLAQALAGGGFFGTSGPATPSNAFKTFEAAKAAAASGATGAGRSAGDAVSGGVNAIGDLAHRLTESTTWIRVGEVAAGLIILYVGLNAILRNTAAGNAVQSTTRTVRKVGQRVIPK